MRPLLPTAIIQNISCDFSEKIWMVWIIKVSPGLDRVKLTLLDVDLIPSDDCEEDYLEIFDGK